MDWVELFEFRLRNFVFFLVGKTTCTANFMLEIILGPGLEILGVFGGKAMVMPHQKVTDQAKIPQICGGNHGVPTHRRPEAGEADNSRLVRSEKVDSETSS
jgi:hypothetical protein